VRPRKIGLENVPQLPALLQRLLSFDRESGPCTFHVIEKRPDPRAWFATSHRVTFSSTKSAFEWVQHGGPLMKRVGRAYPRLEGGAWSVRCPTQSKNLESHHAGKAPL
jgi:hypothetical protein